MRTAVTDRLAGALGTAAVLSLIGLALVIGLRVERPLPPRQVPAALLMETPPPQRHPIAPARSAKRAGRASPPNLTNKATPVQAPPAPAPSPTVVAPIPAVALAQDSGAAPQAGPGEGAGGHGGGPGRGGTGDGDGDGDTPPRQIKGKLDFADVPRALRDAGVGGTVRVRYRVGVDGRVEACEIDASSGNEALDMMTCALIERRFRFIPARDGAGNVVGSTIVQRHIWTNDIAASREEPPQRAE